jgi:hypothetical protein
MQGGLVSLLVRKCESHSPNFVLRADVIMSRRHLSLEAERFREIQG